LPADIPYVFISSVTGYGISALKDLLWRELNADDMVSQFSVSRDSIVHRKLDVRSLHFDEDEEDVSDEFDDDLYDESEDDEDDTDYFEEDFRFPVCIHIPNIRLCCNSIC